MQGVLRGKCTNMYFITTVGVWKKSGKSKEVCINRCKKEGY